MTDTSIDRAGPVTGRAGAVSATLTGLPFRQTPKGKRFPDAEFPPELLYALHAALVAPRRKGFVRRSTWCATCDAALDGIAPKNVPVATRLAFRDGATVDVDLDIPGVTCPRCGRTFVDIDDRALQSDLSHALIKAFEAAGIAR